MAAQYESEYERRARARQTGWNPFGASGPGYMASVSAEAARPKNVRDALNTIAADYVQTATPTTTRGEGLAGQLPNQIKTAAQAASSRLPGAGGATMNPLDMLLADYNSLLSRPEAWQTVGGPNAGLLASLRRQRELLQQNYETNRADAENLYGILSSDIETYGGQLQERYDTTMGQMSTEEQARITALSNEQAAQDERRAAAAAELGASIENVQMGPSQAINEIMATNAGAASNWQNLFAANKLLADESTKRQLTGADLTKNQQLLAMKQFLDQQQAAIDEQIMMESSKSPTRQLTEIGKVLQDAALGAYEDYLNPEEGPLYSQNPAIAKKQQGFEYFGKSMANPADLQWYDRTYASIINKISNAKAGTSPSLTQAEKEFQQVFGITGVGLNIVDPNLLY